MTVATARYPGRAPIDAYGNGGFRFAGMSHRGSLMCLPSGIYAWDAPGIAALQAGHVRRVVDERAEIDLLLLGTGFQHALPPSEVLKTIAEAGIGLEIMATGPACRTYNILLAEGRRVAAGLIAVD
jgi:uncharacterized protein